MENQRKSYRRPGAFVPVPLRARADGWGPRKQAQFLGMLAQTQSVAEAARAVGMSRQTAYRLRAKPESASFALAWDRALGRAEHGSRKVTPDELYRRATGGLMRPVVHRGRYRYSAKKHDVTALLRHLARLDRGAKDWL